MPACTRLQPMSGNLGSEQRYVCGGSEQRYVGGELAPPGCTSCGKRTVSACSASPVMTKRVPPTSSALGVKALASCVLSPPLPPSLPTLCLPPLPEPTLRRVLRPHLPLLRSLTALEDAASRCDRRGGAGCGSGGGGGGCAACLPELSRERASAMSLHSASVTRWPSRWRSCGGH